MLEHLFGSKTRTNLLRLFFNNPKQPYYLRELSRKLKVQLNSIRREMENLEQIGIIKSVNLADEKEIKDLDKSKNKGIKKYFLVDTDFILYPELKALLLKAQLLLERKFVDQIEKILQVKFFVLTGIFVGTENFVTDMLLVGKINRKKIEKLIKTFEKDLGKNINYTVMTEQEFKYRKDITDKFLYDILEGRKIIIIDKINQR